MPATKEKPVLLPSKEEQPYLLYILQDIKNDIKELRQDVNTKFYWMLGGLISIMILIVSLHFK